MRRSRSKSRDLSHQHFDVLVRAKNGADRSGDLSRRKPGGRYLVKQRLKGVVILAVDDGDLNGCLSPELRAAFRPPKPAPTITTRGVTLLVILLSALHLYKIHRDGRWFQKFSGDDSGVASRG